MAKRKKETVPEAPKPCDAWEIVTEMQINGRNVVKGTELKIRNERGRFRFIKYVKTEKGVEWVDVYGGPKGAECIRSFRLDKIKTVHYKNKTDFHLAAEYKQKMKDKKEQQNEEIESSLEED
jgi:hypothetical protein